MGEEGEVPAVDGSPAHGDGEGSLLRAQGAGHTGQAGLPKRGLTAETLRRYGYFVSAYNGQPVHVAPYYDANGEVAAQKLRFPDKTFSTLKASPKAPGVGDCQLFGRPVWGDKHDKRVVVTEGEIDAMTIAQEMNFVMPCVSIGTGAKAASKHIKSNWNWLNRFGEIILWFDDDEHGRAAAEECAQLFAVGKVKLARVDGAKDASDLYQANRPGDIGQAIYAAKAWRPQGIVNAADNSDDVCAPKADTKSGWSYHWPWPHVEEMLGPILPGQVCYQVAGTGIGKSTALAEIEHSLMAQGCKVGHMGFEDTRRDVKLRLMSIDAGERLEVNPRDDAEMKRLHDHTFSKRLIELFDPETAEWTVDAILGYVRYMAKALDCKVIIIDPLTFIAAGMSLGDDERRALDKASRDLAAMAKELGVHLQVAHHLTDPRQDGGHTEGAKTHLNQVRGSGGIANFATFVIGHERNQQAEGDAFLLTRLRALKNRARSITGPMEVLKYDLQTGRLKPTKEQFPEPASASTKRRGGGGAPPSSNDSDF